jgi:hydroxyethylthiazole kinase-like uncharacterized protein yjeF
MPATTPAHPDIQRVDAASGPWPLHDAQTSRGIERDALARQPPHALMELAGQAVARLALAAAPHACHVSVLAGPGNNGGDGLVAARLLHLAGVPVTVLLLGDPARLGADAGEALRRAAQVGVNVTTGQGLPPRTDLVIDALLGLGVTRAAQGDLAEAIAMVNAQRAPVLAVDLPSGLHPDTGTTMGGTAVHATHTLALLTLKPGLFTGQGRDHSGTVWLCDLDAPAAAASAWLTARGQRRPLPHTTHKGQRGDVAVVGGAPGMRGAAWLAARAALASGAGRVYCSLLDAQACELDAMRPELMFRPSWWRGAPAQLASTTVVCGCGGGEAVRVALPALLSNAGRLVLDADALNAIAGDAALHELLRVRAAHGRGTLLTPHPLEAARLLQSSVAEVQADRMAAARALANRCNAAVLLKGSGSVITAPASPVFINSTGNAALATAGTGDVLAGWAGGLWAQAPGLEAQEVAAAAAWLHGRAADECRRCEGAPVLASDLIGAMVAAGIDARA